ncbi:MAG: DHA2 family efflux MFS transporter permease subunit [Solirubrobacteraceae bacterium]
MNSGSISPATWRIAVVIVLGSIMSILDTTIVNVALGTLGRDLHASLSSIQWVVTGYLLSLAAVIPICGWASRRFGAKRVYIAALLMFTAGSALCGLASSSGALIGFRILQGFGGGLILPVGQMILARAAGPQQMGRVMSVIGVPMVLAPVFGPALGGLIIEHLSWQWIFLVNVPIGAAAVTAAVRMLPNPPPEVVGSLDVRGFLLLAAGIPATTYGLTEIGVTGGFSAPQVIAPVLAGLALVALFIVHARSAERPLLDVRLYRRRTFAAASATTFFLGGALFGALILLPLYFQQIRGESIVATGLLVGPQGVGAAIAMPLAGRLADRRGAGGVALVGVLLCALGTLPLALLGADSSLVLISGSLVLRGLGIGLAFMPAMSAAFAALDPSELSDATPQMNVLQRVGGSIGTALLAVVLERAMRNAGPQASLTARAAAFGTAYWWAFGITLVAAIPCLLLARAERGPRVRAGEALVEAL